MKKILIVLIMAILVSACSGPRDEQATEAMMEKTRKTKVDGKFVSPNHKKQAEVPSAPTDTEAETESQE